MDSLLTVQGAHTRVFFLADFLEKYLVAHVRFPQKTETKNHNLFKHEGIRTFLLLLLLLRNEAGKMLCVG